MNNDKVWVVVYSFYNGEDFNDNEVRTKVFDTEKKAEDYLRRDYEAALSECSDEDNVYDVISAENYDNNAEILVGEKDGELIYQKHSWRVQMKTINFEN